MDSKVVDKFDNGKPAKGTLGTLMLNECDEKVFLLMESDLIMEDEVISDGSDAFSSVDETTIRSMVLEDDQLNGEDFDTKLSGDEEKGEENKFYQDASKEAEVLTNYIALASSVIGESKSQEDKADIGQENKLHFHENENMIFSVKEAHESINVMQHYSGPIPYSGSISLRSTSSTASTQSFAFPILAQEWNSSPVRMAKPDKRQLRKQNHSKMKMCCICCKF